MNILLSFENRVFCNLNKPLRRLFRVPSNRCYSSISQSRSSSNSGVFDNWLVKPTVFSLIVRLLPAKVSFISRSAHKSVFNINTNVKKDVLLYEHDSSFVYNLNFLLIGQLITWLSFAYLFHRAINAVSEAELQTISYLDLTQKKWKAIIPLSFIFAGFTMFILGFVFARLLVKKIILLKGGNSVYLETFGIWGLNIQRNIPLDNLTCSVSRYSSKGYIPLKRREKGKLWASYLIDSNGSFKDPELFDMTVGLQRVVK